MATRVVSNRPVTGKVDNTLIEKAVVKSIMVENDVLLLGITIDATLSFSKVYPHVFYYMTEILKYIRAKRTDLLNTQICYSIVLLHDNPEIVLFSDGGVYSSDENEVIQMLRRIEFYGGKPDGTEGLNEAVNKQLQVLNHFPKALTKNKVQKGMVFFTDAIPTDQRFMMNFSSDEPNRYDDYRNEGLRYARFFAYSDAFMPVMRMVDSRGELTEDAANISEYSSLTELLEKNEEETNQFAKATGQAILDALLKE